MSEARHAFPALLSPLLLLLLLAALLSVLGVYAAQVGLGHWQIDEFRYFGDHRALGWRAYFYRFETSPRPLSELLIHWYGTAALWFGRPLVGTALLLTWGVSLLGGTAAAFAVLRPGWGRGVAAAVLGVAPMAFAMGVAGVTEMYYWPVATAAYVPMTAAVTAVLLLTGVGEERRGWWRLALGAALLAAALSHEIGAAFAIGFAGAAGLFALGSGWRGWRDALPWALPGMAGLGVMLALVLFRSHFVDLGADSKPYTGRLLASAGAAGRQMGMDLVSDGDGGQAWGALPFKAAFAVGFGLIWARWGTVRPGRWLAATGAGLGVAVFFSLLAAFYHYGDLCCERQASARQWLIALGLVAALLPAMAWWGRAGSGARTGAWLGPLLVAVSLGPIVGRAEAIRADFQMLDLARSARARTWASGLRAGPRMQFYMPPDNGAMLIHGTSMPVGTYDLGDGTVGINELVGGVGAFFGKAMVDACLAWQSHQSFLINGTRFIPACPPHEGPPDVRFDTGG